MDYNPLNGQFTEHGVVSSALANRLMVVAAALLFSTGGAAIKATQLTAWQTAGGRSIVAAMALLVLIPEARRIWNWRVWPAGLAYSLTLVLFVLATKLTTSANAIFLQSIAPAYLLLLGPLLLKERIKRADILFSLVLACGMVLLFQGTESPLATAPDPSRGNLLAALSGLTYALTLCALRWQAHAGGRDGAAISTVAAGNLIAFGLCLPNALPVERFASSDLGVLLYLGLFQIGLAYWLLTRGMREVPAFETSTLLLMEPVCNPIFTWLILGESPSKATLSGGAVIIAATLVHVWTGRKQA
jgi:drug/metabolite transporter, DME family